MSLLQIQEPDAPPIKTKPRLALGIDLGTTNSLVAVAGNDGQCQTISDDEGRMIMPSLVHYDSDGQVSVGIAARKAAGTDSKSIIASVKRLIGRSDLEVSDNYRYNYSVGDGMVKINTAAGTKNPVEVSAEILRSLAQRAEKAIGEQVAGVIITVPAYFDEAQRQATKTAAELAGLRVLRLLSEPTAAAIAYGLDNAEEGIYAIYDLGGGTFDISILRLQLGIFEVLATGGDTALGGDDYDRSIAVEAAKKMNLSAPSDEDFINLTAAARHTKEALTTADTKVLQVVLNDGCEKTCTISADELAAWGNHLTDKTIAACRRALADAGLTAKQLNGVVLVGGSTRMRSVREAVTQFFGKPPYTGLDPDRVVALGAAAQADVLIGNCRSGNWLLVDVIPLSLGLEMMGGLVEKIIHRNSAIPVSRSHEFTTHQDGQTVMSIHALQGERELVSDCRSLAKVTLSGIPPMAAGQARVRVDFQVDADGLLSVTATEKNTGATAQTTVKPSYGLDEAQISKMLTNAFNNADEDAAKRRISEARLEATTLVQLTEKALNEDGALLNSDEHTTIKQALDGLKNTINSNDAEKIKAATKTLDNTCTDFAERRISTDILRVIGGKSVAEMD